MNINCVIVCVCAGLLFHYVQADWNQQNDNAVFGDIAKKKEIKLKLSKQNLAIPISIRISFSNYNDVFNYNNVPICVCAILHVDECYLAALAHTAPEADMVYALVRITNEIFMNA